MSMYMLYDVCMVSAKTVQIKQRYPSPSIFECSLLSLSMSEVPN
jgi:hypothetical protein